MTGKNSDINLWVVRHGYRIDFSDPHWRETAEHPDNPPLAPIGFEQAAETAERLKDENIDYIIASPFLRTVQTANQIAKKLGKKVQLETGLSEYLSVKDFNCMPELDDPHDLVKDYPFVNPESGHMVSPAYPEDWVALTERVNKALSGIIEKYGTNILIISHGSPIKSLFQTLVGYDGEEYPSMCSVSQFRYESGQWTMDVHDDSAHLTHPDTTRKAFYRERWADLSKVEEL